MSYSDLADDPVVVTQRVLVSLGLDPRSADHIEPGVAKMADAINQDWISRFQAEGDSG